MTASVLASLEALKQSATSFSQLLENQYGIKPASAPVLRQSIPPCNLPSAKDPTEALKALKLSPTVIDKVASVYWDKVSALKDATTWEYEHLAHNSTLSNEALKTFGPVLARRYEQSVLQFYDTLISAARLTLDRLKGLQGQDKRKPQPVFDQRIIDFLLWYFAHPDGGQNPSADEKKKLAKRTGLTLKQVEIWFQNRRARTKKKMAKTGVTNVREVLGDPKRPTFANLPDPMREMLCKKKQIRKEMKKLDRRIERLKQRERERANKPKRIKIELIRRWIREENEPAVDWLCPRAQAEKATRDKLKSGKLKGIDCWSAPAYAYPTEWSQETRDAWWQVDIPCVSEFEHKSTPHPDKPKDVTVTDEEVDALEKQFASLKIEVLKKIYLHQCPDDSIEVIHPKLVRVRKDGSLFMYDDDDLQQGSRPNPAPIPRSIRPRRGDSASRPITVDRPGTSTSHPIIIHDLGSSAQEPIVLGIPGASAAEPIPVGIPGASSSDAIDVDAPGTSPGNPIVVHYPGISISDPIDVDFPGAFASDPISVDNTDAPAVSSALPRTTNPVVIISIPEAPAGHVKVKGAEASEGKGRMPSHESAAGSDSGSSRASSSPGTSLSPSNASFAISSPTFSAIGDATFANIPDMFVTQLNLLPASCPCPYEGVQSFLPPGILDVSTPGTVPADFSMIDNFVTQHNLLPASYPYPYEGVQSSLPPGIFDVPTSGTVPADLSMINTLVIPDTTSIPVPVNSAPPEVPIIDPVQTRQPRTFEEELAEIFKNIDKYNPQEQILPQGDINWEALLAPPTVATVYQSIPEVPGSASDSGLAAPGPQAQIVMEPQPDLLMQMQTGQFDTWTAAFGDTYPELPRMEDIPPPSAWEGAFDPTLEAFLDQFWASDAAAAFMADSTASTALPSQGFDSFNPELSSIIG